MTSLATALALGLLAALGPQHEPEKERARPGVERAPILDRDPAELPRAEPGAWDGMFDDGEEMRAAFESLGPELLGAMKESELLYERDDYPASLERLFAILEEKPDFPPALLQMATTYFRLRRYGDCAVLAERFLEVAPSQVWRTQVLGHAYYSVGEYARARDHYERVLAEIPESPEAVRGYALAHMRLGEYERALELLDRVLELRPGHGDAHAWRAQILYDLNRLEEALEAAERARELDPHHPRPWYLRTQILWALGRDEEAEASEERWREIDRVAQEVRALEGRLLYHPGRYGILIRLAELHLSVGNVDGLREALAEAALHRPPEVPEVALRIHVLDALLEAGDEEGARVAALALEETCPDEVEAWRRLLVYWGERGEVAKQAHAARRVSELSRP